MINRILLTLLLLSLALPASAYPCFYETSPPVRRGTGQNLLAGAVDTATGAFIKVFKCQTIPGPTPITGYVYYNTQDASRGPFGIGTSTSYDYYIRATSSYPGATYELIAPGNLHYAFDTLNGTNYSDTHDPELLGATLSFTGQPTGVTSTLTWKGGIRYQFDASGGLMRIIDVPGNTLNVLHNQINGFVASVSSPTNTNRVLQFRQDTGSNHVTQLLCQYSYLGNVRRWNFTYDAISPTGKLTTIADPLSHNYTFTWTSYTRSDGQVLPLLATGTDGRGMTCLSLHYDSSGRVTSQDNATGGALTYTYSAALGSDGTVTGVNPAGASTTVAFTWAANHFGYLVTQVTDNTKGETTTLAHTASPTYLTTSVTDYRGRVRTLTYNPTSGDLLSSTLPRADSGTATISYTYDPIFHRRTSMTDPLNRVTTWSVNATTGNIDSTTNPAGETTTYLYNSLGQLTSSTDALGHLVTWGYDTYGLRTSIVQPAGGTASVVRDDLGEITQVTDEVGNSVYYTYDLLGRVASISAYPYPNAPANTILTNSYTYDAVGNRLSATDPAGHVWSWTYDCANEPLTETNPLGQVRRWTWTPSRQVASYTDFVGNTTTSTYLADGRIAGTTYKNPSGGTDSTLTFNYDATTHLLTSKVDSLTGTYSYTTDLLERLTNLSTPNGSVAYSYDVLGRPTTMTPTGQGAITYGYHVRGTVASITQNGATTNITCNALGQVTSKALPNGVTTNIVRDANGNITSVASDKAGVVFDSSSYSYDAANRLTQIVATSGSRHTLTYTNYNQVASVTDQDNPANTITYTYNPVGTRASQTINGVTTPYGYNAANQLTAVGSNSLTLNANGNPTAYNGTTFGWNSRNQLTNYSGGGNTVSYTYTPRGTVSSSVVNGVATTTLGTFGTILRQTVGGTPVDYLTAPGGIVKAGSNYVSANGQRSTTALTNGTGTVVGNYGYDPFGVATHTGTASTPIQFAGGLSDVPALVTVGSTSYSPVWATPYNRTPPVPTTLPLPGFGTNTNVVSTQHAEVLPSDEGEGTEYGGGGGGYAGSYTGAPNYAAGCGPVPDAHGVSTPENAVANNSAPTTIRLALNPTSTGRAACAPPSLCQLEEEMNLYGIKYPFHNIDFPEDQPAQGPGRITYAMGKADIIEMDVTGLNQEEAFNQDELWAAGGYTNTEFQLCHTVEIAPKVRWMCNGETISPPLWTYNGPISKTVQARCNMGYSPGLFIPYPK